MTKKPDLSHLHQPSLVPLDVFYPEVSPEEQKPPLKRRPRKLDDPVLKFIQYFGVVTSYQVLYSFFVYQGKGPVYGWRLLKQLRENDLIRTYPIFPEKGAASLQAISLTEKGYHSISTRPNKKFLGDLPFHELAQALQYAEMRLQRNSEGWDVVRQSAAFETLRRWALMQYRGRMLNDSEALARTRIERIPETTFPHQVLIHRQRGWIRIVLTARKGKSFQRLLEDLPSFDLFPRIPFELVCADPELSDIALDLLRRYATKNRFRYSVSVAAHFNHRQNPRQANLSVSLPQEEGDSNPLAPPLIKGP